MDAASLDNANPTVLSTADLPQRQQKRVQPRQGPDSKYADLIFSKPSFLQRPFAAEEDGACYWPGGEDIGGDESDADPIDEQEIYDLISPILDPEHPVSLGQLSIVNLPDIHITPSPALGVPDPNTIVRVHVEVTPTVNHCSLATILGLGVRVRLEHALPPNYRIDVVCKENTHGQDEQVNKQLADKERVAAALENDSLRGVLDKMLEPCF